MSTRRNPFEEMQRFFDRMSRQFEDVAGSWEGEGPLGRFAPEAGEMRLDLVEHDDAFEATVDLPGYERDDVTVRVTDHTLRISAERDSAHESEEADYVHSERSHESQERSIHLPEEVETEEVSARMRNGVLTVTLPKRAVEETRAIEIEDE